MLQRYKNILVPVDGSREAELAFKKAVSVAKRNGDETTLHLVHVVDTRAFQNISSFDTAMVDQVTETAKKTMEGYVESAKQMVLRILTSRLNMALRKPLSQKTFRKIKRLI